MRVMQDSGCIDRPIFRTGIEWQPEARTKRHMAGWEGASPENG